jgi:putative transposase
MFVIEYKVTAKEYQYRAIDDAIRTAQFVRNKALRYWMDNKGISKYDLNKYSRIIAKEHPFVNDLNSTARQASAERAWSGIARFFDNCKKQVRNAPPHSSRILNPRGSGVKGKKGYPKFKRNARSVEYKHSGWKLDPKTKKHITFTDKKGIGRLKLVGSRDIYFYQPEQIKRVRLIRRADGYYCQFCISIEVKEDIQPSGKAIGLDVGLKYFCADSNGHTEENPRFYRQDEKRLNKLNRRKSRKFVKGKKPQSKNYHKARNRYARLHLRISRKREEHAKRLARTVCTSNDCICYEDLPVKNLVRNHHLSKSINDAGWYQFRKWIEYFGWKFGKITVAVPPHFTTQDCPVCGKRTQKSLSNRTHNCSCGYIEDRDVAASINILKKGLSTGGHLGTWLLDSQNASGDLTATFSGEILFKQVESLNEESPHEA